MNKIINPQFDRIIEFNPFSSTISSFQNLVTPSVSGLDSDQLNIQITYPNKKISDEFLNSIITEFDRDGINDRQLEYQRTIDFVDSRSIILSNELRQIELKKQEFKEKNNLTDIRADAQLNVDQKFNYSSELFQKESQKDIAEFLIQSLPTSEYDLLPLNIGIDDNLQSAILDYNKLIDKK